MQATELSIVRGIPLEDEPGQGALTIPGYLREVTGRYADREAVVMHGPDGVVRWTYRELWEQSLAVAKALIAAGVGKDSRVGILMVNRPEYLAALFGTAMAGGCSVALSTFSTTDELKHLLTVSNISVLLFDRQVLKKDFAAMLRELEPAIVDAAPGALRSISFPYLERLVELRPATHAGEHSPPPTGAIETWEAFVPTGADVPTALVEARADSVSPGDIGGLFFSSGTTSLPKGILHAQRAFTIQWWRWPRVLCVREPARSWTGNGFFWSGNVTMIVGTALSTGGAVILQATFEAESALRLMEAERVTLVNGRPHQWARLQAAPNWAETDLSSLRYITKGELMMEHPTVDSDWQLPNSYGNTETMTISTSFDSDTPAERYAGSFGGALPGNLMKIVDPRTGAPMPVGERGELCIKGPTMMLGYLGKTVEETFDDEGYFRTGDGGYVDAEGRLFWEGRLNDIIKTGGANVSPEEVDTVIATYPGVKRAQTVGVPHPTLSEMVVSCIVPVDGETLDEAAVVAYLKERLASFKVPRKVLFFAEEDFALTGNEKVKTAELRNAAVARLGELTAA